MSGPTFTPYQMALVRIIFSTRMQYPDLCAIVERMLRDSLNLPLVPPSSPLCR